VNKITGESCWTLPPSLLNHPSFVRAIGTKKARNRERAPCFEDFIRTVFFHHSNSGEMTILQFWEAFDNELHMAFWLATDEKMKLEKDIFLDGREEKICVDEFLAVMIPLLKQTLSSRGGPEWWVSLDLFLEQNIITSNT
jgi:hypothetical protein